MKPWYRSRLLWLGVAPLVFLLWLWHDSTRAYSFAGAIYGYSGGLISNISGQITLAIIAAPVSPEPFDGFMHRQVIPDIEFSAFAPAVTYSKPDSESVELTVGHWFLVLLYIGFWLLIFCLWRRRIRRKLAQLTGSVGLPDREL